MRQFSSVLLAGLAFGWVAAGSATSASAHYRHGCNCGPIPPSTYYKTVHPHRYMTRVHDVSVVRHKARIHLVRHITLVQPIVDVHEVTRVHHHTVFYTKTVYSSGVRHLPPIVNVRHSVHNTYDCHCGY